MLSRISLALFLIALGGCQNSLVFNGIMPLEPTLISIPTILNLSTKENVSQTLTFSILGAQTNLCSSSFIAVSAATTGIFEPQSITGTNDSCSVSLRPVLNVQGSTLVTVTLLKDSKAISRTFHFTVGPTDPLFELDTSFSVNGNFDFLKTNWSYLSNSAVSSDGNLLLFSSTFNSPKLADAYIHKIDVTLGALDTNFNSTGEMIFDFGGNADHPKNFILESDGKITALLGSSNPAGQYRINISRTLANGTPDTSFGVGGNVDIDVCGSFCLTTNIVKVSSKYYVTGRLNHSDNMYLFRLNESGTLDGTMPLRSHDPTPSSHKINGGALLSDESHLYSLYHTDWQYESAQMEDFFFCKFDLEGLLVTSFANSGCLTILGNNNSKRSSGKAIFNADKSKIYLAGSRNNAPFITKIDAVTGQIDTSFGVSGYVTISGALALVDIKLHPTFGLIANSVITEGGKLTYAFDVYKASDGTKWAENKLSTRFIGSIHPTIAFYAYNWTIKDNTIYVSGQLYSTPMVMVVQKIKLNE